MKKVSTENAKELISIVLESLYVRQGKLYEEWQNWIKKTPSKEHIDYYVYQARKAVEAQQVLTELQYQPEPSEFTKRIYETYSAAITIEDFATAMCLYNQSMSELRQAYEIIDRQAAEIKELREKLEDIEQHRSSFESPNPEH